MKKRLDWIEISVLIGGISILIAIIYPMVQSAREAAARNLCFLSTLQHLDTHT